MNELQHISEEIYGPVLVTLNPPFDPDPETLGGRYEYDHPVLGIKVSLELYAPSHPAVQCFFFAGCPCTAGAVHDPEQAGDLLRRRLDEIWIP